MTQIKIYKIEHRWEDKYVVSYTVKTDRMYGRSDYMHVRAQDELAAYAKAVNMMTKSGYEVVT